MCILITQALSVVKNKDKDKVNKKMMYFCSLK